MDALVEPSTLDVPGKVRQAEIGSDPEVLTHIYREEVNLAVWQRSLSAELQAEVVSFVEANPTFKASLTLAPDTACEGVQEALSFQTRTGKEWVQLSDNITELVDMFCCLFDLKRAGLRLSVLDRAMCPKFHVDKVPCRLVTTFQGIATEWLPHAAVDRRKLGAGSQGLADSESGLYSHADRIQRLCAGEVALLKGERWDGNENAGLVHRSPVVGASDKRLLMTLDFSD